MNRVSASAAASSLRRRENKLIRRHGAKEARRISALRSQDHCVVTADVGLCLPVVSVHESFLKLPSRGAPAPGGARRALERCRRRDRLPWPAVVAGGATWRRRCCLVGPLAFRWRFSPCNHLLRRPLGATDAAFEARVPWRLMSPPASALTTSPGKLGETSGSLASPAGADHGQLGRLSPNGRAT